MTDRETIEQLKERLADCYQIIGCMAHFAGVFDRQEIQHVLDMLADERFDVPLTPFNYPMVKRSQ